MSESPDSEFFVTSFDLWVDHRYESFASGCDGLAYRRAER